MTTRPLRDVLVEAAHAIADAIEALERNSAPRRSRASRATKPARGGDDLDEKNERIRLAYNKRAEQDRKQLEAKAAREPLTDDEIAALSLLSSGYRLMPQWRERLGLKASLKIQAR